MKFFTILLGLSIMGSALADSATLSAAKNKAEISGVMRGVGSEIFSIVAKAHQKGFKLDNGADVFDMLSTPNRVGGSTLYKSKLISAKVQSGITLSYGITLVTKKGEMSLKNDVLTLTGETAKLLKGAMAFSHIENGPRPLGSSTETSPSGKVFCSRVVYPNAPTTCVIKL
ncbi:MAG: hypothetical protein K2P81_09200 [Bacteriovoracaceae bacterium]|nr:hypothetical protein [Bacteriovoracaceae bacterium]